MGNKFKVTMTFTLITEADLAAVERLTVYAFSMADLFLTDPDPDHFAERGAKVIEAEVKAEEVK